MMYYPFVIAFTRCINKDTMYQSDSDDVDFWRCMWEKTVLAWKGTDDTSSGWHWFLKMDEGMMKIYRLDHVWLWRWILGQMIYHPNRIVWEGVNYASAGCTNFIQVIIGIMFACEAVLAGFYWLEKVKMIYQLLASEGLDYE